MSDYAFPQSITCEVLDKNAKPIGEKTFYNLPAESYLSNWIKRPKPNGEPCCPLTNAIEPPKGERRDQRGTKWSDGSVAFMCAGTNDFQNQQYIFLLSSGASRGHGFFVNQENLWQCAVYFTVAKIILHTWQNHNDQFLKPTKELSEEFKNDCLIWMLFNEKNLTAGADGLEWNGKYWSIVNHFIPFTESEVNANDRFESDFMVQYMQDKLFSAEATAVLNEGRKIWQKYFETDFNHQIRDTYKLNRTDVGWYQIRMALKAWNESGENIPVSFEAFENAYRALTEKLQPLVYEYGFLK